MVGGASPGLRSLKAMAPRRSAAIVCLADTHRLARQLPEARKGCAHESAWSKGSPSSSSSTFAAALRLR